MGKVLQYFLIAFLAALTSSHQIDGNLVFIRSVLIFIWSLFSLVRQIILVLRLSPDFRGNTVLNPFSL